MRLAIREELSRHEVLFGPKDLTDYKRRKMMHSLANHLVNNMDELIRERLESDGSVSLFCQLNFMSDLEQDRIYRHAEERAARILMEHQPIIVDDFGNEIKSVNLAQKLHNHFAGVK